MKKVLKLIAGFTAGICVIASGFSSVEKYNIIDIGTIVEAEDYTEGTYGLMTYRKYNSYVEITDCDESVTEIEIPAQIDGLPITKIGNLAFENCSKLTNIIIPDSVAWIGAKAFYQCRKIEKIRIPDAVTYIGEYAFSFCSKLKDINIPQGIASIEAHTFEHCKEMQNINIPDTVTFIGEYAFNSCSKLKDINIPQGVKSIENYTFHDCIELENINIPDSITKIGDCAFGSMSKITIAGVVVSGCGITSISIPDSVTSIGNYAFSNCIYLTSVTIPDSVTEIGRYAFSGCTNLTEFTVPKGIKEIEQGMFSGCDRLSKVTMSSNIEKINSYAFDKCYYLTDIYYNGAKKQWDLITKEEKGNDYLLNVNIHTIGSGYTDELGYIVKPDNTIGIIGMTDASMKEIEIPSEIEGLSVTGIEWCAFGGQVANLSHTSLYGLSFNSKNLVSIIIPNSVKNIESSAFSNFFFNDNLKDIYYKGTEEEWRNITISDSNNDRLFSATIHYNYSGKEVTTTTTDIITTTTTTTTTTTKPAAPQLSQKMLYLSLNDTHKLFMKNTNSTPSWKSNDNSIVSISDDGTVTANGVGETSVVATIDNQEFVCNVYILEKISYGNLDDNNEISVDDASIVLDMYAKTAAGLNTNTTLNQKASADVNRDGEINVDDASVILSYYAKNAAGMPTTWEELIS